MYRFIDFFPLKEGQIIAFVGCGGKTSLIEGIIRERENCSPPVIYTTTVKIYPPEERKFILGSNIQDIIEGIRSTGDSLITTAFAINSENKLLGLPVEWFNKLLGELPRYSILVEADGCRGKSIKIYRENEPCLPPETEMIIILAGIDAFTCFRIEEKVHRYQLFREIFFDKEFRVLQDRIDTLFHAKGLITKLPKEIRKVLFLNKVTEATLEQAREIADLLLEKSGGRLVGVLIGNTFEKPMIFDYRR